MSFSLFISILIRSINIPRARIDAANRPQMVGFFCLATGRLGESKRSGLGVWILYFIAYVQANAGNGCNAEV